MAMDRAGPVRSFMRIGVPLAVAAIVTVRLFAFLAAWIPEAASAAYARVVQGRRALFVKPRR
jgi:ABC-type glycerol-3-phosphate transport system permease component